MKRDLMRDVPHFYVVGDRVFTIPGGMTILRPFDEMELGMRVAHWLESEWLGYSAIEEVTCAACRCNCNGVRPLVPLNEHRYRGWHTARPT